MHEGSGGGRVAIVGCGVAGLSAIKACLEEGLQPQCFEINSQLGGVWYAPDTPKYGDGPQMYDSLITNTSKAMMCFSDFPCPSSYPPYLPHRLFQQYLESYAQHFKLLQHVVFNTKVLEVRKTEDYDVTGRWVVITCNMDGSVESEEQTSAVYDGVILCQGFFCSPYIPDIPGLSDRFQGGVSHVNSYKNAQPFKDRTVVVVGSASSALDVACDIAPTAKQVYLCVHEGAYVISRLYKGVMPADFRLTRLALEWASRGLIQYSIARSAAQYLNPVTSGLQPQVAIPGTLARFVIHDLLPFKVFTGQVRVVCAMERVAETGDLHLQDGQVLTQVDHILFGTGYKSNFTAIDPSILTSEPESGKLELYKMVFPMSLPHDSLALVGCYRAAGPIPPATELQARLAARVLAGRHQLPERSIRQQDVDRTNQEQLRDHGSYKYSFTSLAIADNVAAELGVKPIWWHLLLRGDVKMAFASMLGPAYPFHYRLMGPHPWAGAREATLRAYDDTVYSVQHRKVGGETGGRRTEAVWGRVCLVILVPMVAAVIYYFGWHV